NAPLKIIRLHDRLDDVEHCPELSDRRISSTLADHFSKRILEPYVLPLEHSQHQIVLAFEMLVERRFADADVRQNLVDADVSKAVAIEAPGGRVDQPLARLGWHENLS